MTKVYEQEGTSGLYRLAGECRHGRFKKATGQRPLKTLRQWQAVQRSPSPGQAKRMTLCGFCGEEFELTRDQSGDLMPCPNCGRGWKDASMPGQPLRFETFAAPATLDRVVALQQDPHLVSEAHPVAVQSIASGPPRRRETYAPRTNLLDGVLAYQRERGMREKATPPLYTMDDKGACERCHRKTCDCPPAPPSTLDAAVRHHALQVQRQHDADVLAYPALTRKL